MLLERIIEFEMLQRLMDLTLKCMGNASKHSFGGEFGREMPNKPLLIDVGAADGLKRGYFEGAEPPPGDPQNTPFLTIWGTQIDSKWYMGHFPSEFPPVKTVLCIFLTL